MRIQTKTFSKHNFKGKESNSSNTKGSNITPMFPGGEGCLDDFIEKNMEYLLSAKKDSVEGRVFVGYIVNANGKISDVSVLKFICAVCIS